MKTTTDFKYWNYEVSYLVPTTPKGGGEITWEYRNEHCEIYLPADTMDPERYLQQSSEANSDGIVEYSFFSE
jgi:hypothetical protein